MTSADTVRAVATDVFVRRDPSTVDRHYTEDFIQHSPLAQDGRDGIRQFVRSIPDDFRVDLVRMLDDHGTMGAHSAYEGLGPEPLVGFDVFRVEDGRIAEHWDVFEPLRTRSDGARPQLDGPVAVTDRDRTQDNKRIAAEWVESALVAGDHRAVQDHMSSRGCTEHAARTPDGPQPAYRRLRRVVGEGNFVLTVAEAVTGGDRGDGAAGTVACYDLWRLGDGRIVEHWGVAQPVPERTAHANGMF
ncbi:nuclear transport factor 2 family protein [Kocuria nitroreducens]|uniref:nuclear transport factor 2 family protein n=1 Tax=Kocuria nitroreducens TaxID=3058914 RepID=UPI0036D9FCC4